MTDAEKELYVFDLISRHNIPNDLSNSSVMRLIFHIGKDNVVCLHDFLHICSKNGWIDNDQFNILLSKFSIAMSADN